VTLPVILPVIRRTTLVAVALLVGATTSACGSSSGEPRATDGRLAMVSGRDDHGLMALENVPVYDAPRSGHSTAAITDATLVQVTEADGTWQHVQTVEGQHVEGWLDDFYLRGEVRLVGAPPSCESRIGSTVVTGGTLVTIWRAVDNQVQVEEVAAPHLRGWAARGDVQELSPQGTDCGEDPPDSKHHH